MSREETNSDQDRELMKLMQDMSEYDLTSQVIQPLMHSFGYDRVDYHGGPDEEGKDVLCWRTDELGDLELAVVQVKKYRPSKKAADTRSFSEIVTQLSQAAEKTVPSINSLLYKPSAIYLVTPFPIDTKALKSRLEGILALRLCNLKLIDGPRMSRLVRQRLPKVARQLYGHSLDFTKTLLPELNNDILMRALDARTGRDLRSFYTDLDIAMGKSSNRLILLGKLQPKILDFSLISTEWKKLSNVCRRLSKVLGEDALGGRVGQIEKRQQDRESENSEKQSALSKIDLHLKELSEQTEPIENEIREENARIRASDPSIRELERNIVTLRSKFVKMVNSRGVGEIAETAGKAAFRERGATPRFLEVLDDSRFARLTPITPDEIELNREIRLQERRLNIRLRPLRPLFEDRERIKKKRQLLSRDRKKIARSIAEPKFNGNIDGIRLALALEKHRQTLLEKIAAFNRQPPRVEVLRQFLDESERIFQAGAEILRNAIIAEALGIEEVASADAAASVRLAIPISRVFDTGVNIILLGEAGAGKTTSLQNYATSRLEKSRPGDFTLFFPLSRVLDCWARDVDFEDQSLRRLECGLCSYLRHIGIRIEAADLEKVFRDGRCVVLLDGIDEVIKNYPWIASAIGDVSQRFPVTQIVASARTSARGIEELPFIALTLLPFTDEQREHFVRSWFFHMPSSADNILHHLAKRRGLDEIVRNPLLATILCVLEENSVPLPDNELRLYEERMRLLVGDYDIHKGVRRIKSQRYFLRLASQKLAFRLHCAVRREATREEFFEWTAEALCDQLQPRACRKLVDELIDPCNILYPMTQDGRFGFGHLRYQEYLTALELLQNRSIQILEVARQHWWRGVMVLFSQMNQSIDWFLKDMVKGRTLGMIKDVALAMIEARPYKERARLKKYVAERVVVEGKRYKEIDAFLLQGEDETWSGRVLNELGQQEE